MPSPSISGSLSINEAGEVAFAAALTGTSGGTTDNAAIYKGNGASTVQLVRKGQFAPDGNGRYFELGLRQLVLNDRGEVLFHAALTGTTGGATEGLFLAGGGQIRQIARLSHSAPGGGVFQSFGRVMGLNNTGQIAFMATVDDGTTLSDGVFFHDGASLVEVVREGSVLPGFGTISTLIVSAQLEGEGRQERSILNDFSQVVFTFIAGGQTGVALWTADTAIFSDGFESGSTTAWTTTVP